MLVSLRKQSGVGLIEVLVTMLVLAVGLLGIAALQNSALRFSHTAAMESQAQFLIRDVVDSMRLTNAPQQFLTSFGNAVPAAPTDCKTTNCSTANALAAWSLEQWINNVRALLPNGDAEIRLVNAAAKTYEISIRYDDLRGEAANAATQAEAMRTVSVVTRI